MCSYFIARFYRFYRRNSMVEYFCECFCRSGGREVDGCGLADFLVRSFAGIQVCRQKEQKFDCITSIIVAVRQ